MMRAALSAFAIMLLMDPVAAQPQGPELSFIVVRDAKGRPLKGAYAENAMAREALTTKRHPAWTVETHFTVPTDYPYGPERPGDHTGWSLTGAPLEDRAKQYLNFHVMDCWCTGLYMLVIQGRETMRIDLPDAPAERWALVEHAMQRSGDHASPEIIRFRAGRFAFADLMLDPAFDALETRLAQGLKRTADEAYQRQLAEQERTYREHPPVSAPQAVPPTSTRTPARIEAEIAARPGLQNVELEQATLDTVRVRINGRVMLDGGCASGMPLFGLEQLSDTGWVACIPFELIQMDCGLPWADCTDRSFVLPLAWWVRTRCPADRKTLLPGTYRLVFTGADLKEMRTAAFTLR